MNKKCFCSSFPRWDIFLFSSPSLSRCFSMLLLNIKSHILDLPRKCAPCSLPLNALRTRPPDRRNLLALLHLIFIFELLRNELFVSESKGINTEGKLKIRCVSPLSCFLHYPSALILSSLPEYMFSHFTERKSKLFPLKMSKREKILEMTFCMIEIPCSFEHNLWYPPPLFYFSFLTLYLWSPFLQFSLSISRNYFTAILIVPWIQLWWD